MFRYQRLPDPGEACPLGTHWPDAGGYYSANIEGVEHGVEATLCFGHAGEQLDLRGGRKSHGIDPALDESVDKGPAASVPPPPIL